MSSVNLFWSMFGACALDYIQGEFFHPEDQREHVTRCLNMASGCRQVQSEICCFNGTGLQCVCHLSPDSINTDRVDVSYCFDQM